MNQPIVVIGLGEMGGVFSRGFLRLGYPIYPITRSMDVHKQARHVADPTFVLVAVAETDLQTVLAELPDVWRDRVVLLQNELLPSDWKSHRLADPTVISVWFEKKRGQDVKVLLPSPVFGTFASDIVSALAAIDIPARSLPDSVELEYELVRKNVYILTTNIAGLVVGGNVKELWESHRDLAIQIANEVIDIQQAKVGHPCDRERLIKGLQEGIFGDLHHKCMGRTAPARLQRALEYADSQGLAVAKLRDIAKTTVATK